LNPDYPTTHDWYSQYLLAAGRPEEAIQEIKRAQELNPESLAINLTAGNLFFRLHQYDQAMDEYRKVLQIDENFAPAIKAIGHIYEKKSMLKEASAAYEKVRQLSGLPPVTRFSQDFIKWSKKDSAHYLMNKLSFMLRQNYVRPSYIAG